MALKEGHYSSSRAAVILLAAALAASIAGYYAHTVLRVETDTAELLSDKLPARRTMAWAERLFPHSDPKLLLVVEALSPERSQAAADRLLDRVRQRPDHFAHAHRPHGGPFFQKHALLYRNLEQLQDLSTRVSRMQPLLAMLQSDPTLAGLFEPLGRLVGEDRFEPAGVDRLLEQLDRVVRAQLDGRLASVSWQRLMQGVSDHDAIARTVVFAQPSPAGGRRRAMQWIDQIAAEMSLGGREYPRLGVTGTAALAHEEMRTLKEGMLTGGPIALVLVAVVLYIGFRSIRLCLATLVTLVVGLVLTAAFAAAAVGRLNLISIAFGLLYVGLGVDFAIHFILRYRALRRRGERRHIALAHTRSQMVRTLSLCALTTAIGFLAFVPTAFAGVAELGIIAGGGMVISLAVTLTVLPALLALGPARENAKAAPAIIPRPIRWMIERPARHRRSVLGAAAVASLACALIAPAARFNTDPLDLRPAASQAVQTLRALRAGPGIDGEGGAFVLEPSRERARRIADKLSALPQVDRAVTVMDLIPDNQPAKLAEIERLALLAGPGGLLEPQALSIGPVDGQVRAIGAFCDKLARADAPQGSTSTVRRDLHESLTAWLDSLAGMTQPVRRARVADLHERVLSSLPLALDRFGQALAAGPVSLQTLPASLKSRWVSPDGTYRVEVRPAAALEDDADRRAFVDAVRSIVPTASGSTVIQVEAGRAIITAFRKALLYATAGIAFLLIVLMRSFRRSLLVVLPLAAGGVMTVAGMVLLDIPFNFANVIALPLLLGVGVDNGIHMVQRSRRTLAAPGGLLETTTARGVLFSTLTTLCGFGGLALSPHPGTASMGQLLSIGLILIVACTLVLLPALVPPRSRTPPATPPGASPSAR